MSLKKILNDKIQQAGQMGIDEIYQLAEDNSYRQSNAERRLRESPNLKPVFDEKHKYIVAYKWIGESIESPEIYQDNQQTFKLI
jgi:hypothetical protein